MNKINVSHAVFFLFMPFMVPSAIAGAVVVGTNTVGEGHCSVAIGHNSAASTVASCSTASTAESPAVDTPPRGTPIPRAPTAIGANSQALGAGTTAVGGDARATGPIWVRHLAAMALPRRYRLQVRQPSARAQGHLVLVLQH